MEFVNLNPSEKQIVNDLRTLKPFERMEIVADKDGKPATYLVTRTQKAILIVGTMNYTK